MELIDYKRRRKMDSNLHKQKQKQVMQQQQQMMQQDPRYIKAQADVQKVQIEGQELIMKQEQNEFERQIKIAELHFRTRKSTK